MGATQHTAAAPAQATVSADVAAKIPDATRRVMADASGFTRWLHHQCLNFRRDVPAEPLPADITAPQLKFMCVASLVSVIADMRQPYGASLAARDALTLRYLTDPIVQARVVATARQIHADEQLSHAQGQEDVDAQLKRVNAATALLLTTPVL